MAERNNSRIVRTIPVLIAVCLFSIPTQAQYGGGTGEPNDPYLVYTAEQTNAIGAEPNDWDKHFKLTADIDLAGITYSIAVIPQFAGTLDGNGYSISNLTIAGDRRLGLIGTITSSAQVSNLGAVDGNVTGTEDHIGILAGINRGHVSRCYSTGIVRGDLDVGGLVGQNTGSITTCYSTSSVSGTSSLGGLLGYNFGAVTHCYSTSAANSTGVVNGNWWIGGLVSLPTCMRMRLLI